MLDIPILLKREGGSSYKPIEYNLIVGEIMVYDVVGTVNEKSEGMTKEEEDG